LTSAEIPNKFYLSGTGALIGPSTERGEGFMAQVNAPTPPAWRELHQAVLRESDSNRLHGMILAVEEAMFLRAQQLDASEAHRTERAAIEQAAEELLSIKTEKLGWPAIS
jgi:hypothetical protein